MCFVWMSEKGPDELMELDDLNRKAQSVSKSLLQHYSLLILVGSSLAGEQVGYRDDQDQQNQ